MTNQIQIFSSRLHDGVPHIPLIGRVNEGLAQGIWSTPIQPANPFAHPVVHPQKITKQWPHVNNSLNRFTSVNKTLQKPYLANKTKHAAQSHDSTKS